MTRSLFIIIAFFGLLAQFLHTPLVRAQNTNCSFSTDPAKVVVPAERNFTYKPNVSYSIRVDNPGDIYNVILQNPSGPGGSGFVGWEDTRPDRDGVLKKDGAILNSSNNLYVNSNLTPLPFFGGTHSIVVERYENNNGRRGNRIDSNYCSISYNIQEETPAHRSLTCDFSVVPGNPNSDTDVAINAKIDKPGQYKLTVSGNGQESRVENFSIGEEGAANIRIGKLREGSYGLKLQMLIERHDPYINDTNCRFNNLVISSISQNPDPNDPPKSLGGGSPQTNLGSVAIPGCSEGAENCTKAAGQSCTNGEAGIQTAIGCVPTDPVTLINRFLSFAIGAAGGIALLLMMFGSFEMVTSQGDPKNLQNGRERFVAALTGLLFILFSVVFLKIIGVDILGLDQITKSFNLG